MNFQRLTFITSLLMTAVMLLVVYIFDALKEGFSNTDQKFYLTMGISALVFLVINYFVIEFLLNFYAKKQNSKDFHHTSGRTYP